MEKVNRANERRHGDTSEGWRHNVSERTRIVLTGVILAVSCVIISGVSIALVYRTDLDDHREHMSTMAHSQAALIESIAAFDTSHSVDFPGGSREATLTQIIEAHNHFKGFGSTGEFVIASERDGEITFVFAHSGMSVEIPHPVADDLTIAEPMRRALAGESGSMIGRDYKGRRVLAAYEPVSELGLGVVAKMDMAEINADFFRVGILCGLIAIVVIAGGVVSISAVTRPVLSKMSIRAKKAHSVADLSQLTLMDISLQDLLDEAVQTVTKVLGVGFSSVLEFQPDEESLLMVAGVGWKDGLVGEARVSSDVTSQAGYALQRDESVLVEDLQQDTRFKDLTLLKDHEIVSGMSVVISGDEHPYGVLSVHDMTRRVFGEDDAQYLHAVANLLSLAIERKIREERLLELSRAVEQSPVAVAITNAAGIFEYVNPKFEVITGYTSAEVRGQHLKLLNSKLEPPEFYEELWTTLAAGNEWHGEFCNKKKDEITYWVSASISPVQNKSGETTHFVTVQEDITEQKLLVAQLAQAQKLESIGQLASGIAHEINTPTQYVGDNISFLSSAFEKIRDLLVDYRNLVHEEASELPTAEDISQLEAKEKKVKLDFLLREIPKAFEQSKEGVARIAKIVRSMKEFSHPGTEEKVQVDLNHAIENTISVARNEWKYVADIESDFDENLPAVTCLPAEINQVILNILVNAAQAIGEHLSERDADKGMIKISTSSENGSVVIKFTDDGPGIPEKIRARIFDPFFTTKEVGKGTGQGLAIAHSVVVKDHGGSLTCETEEGKGTTFTIHLPISEEVA